MGARPVSALVIAPFVLLGVWLFAGCLTQPSTTPAAAVADLPPLPAQVPATSVTVDSAPVTPSAAAGGDSAGPMESPRPARVQIDAAWLATTAAATGIPRRALAAYASATLQLSAEQPACRLGWTTLAAVGAIESDHARHGGARLDESGRAVPLILGPPLDGGEFALIEDTDGGLLDGDAAVDRALGPFQFIPGTWRTWAADGDGDGAADPHDIDDAALAAGRYLCSSGDLSEPVTWHAAIHSYNHDDAYVRSVLEEALSLSAAAP